MKQTINFGDIQGYLVNKFKEEPVALEIFKTAVAEALTFWDKAYSKRPNNIQAFNEDIDGFEKMKAGERLRGREVDYIFAYDLGGNGLFFYVVVSYDITQELATAIPTVNVYGSLDVDNTQVYHIVYTRDSISQYAINDKASVVCSFLKLMCKVSAQILCDNTKERVTEQAKTMLEEAAVVEEKVLADEPKNYGHTFFPSEKTDVLLVDTLPNTLKHLKERIGLDDKQFVTIFAMLLDTVLVRQPHAKNGSLAGLVNSRFADHVVSVNQLDEANINIKWPAAPSPEKPYTVSLQYVVQNEKATLVDAVFHLYQLKERLTYRVAIPSGIDIKLTSSIYPVIADALVDVPATDADLLSSLTARIKVVEDFIQGMNAPIDWEGIRKA